eukprot:452198-Rhodomonas_salina.3
MSGTDIAYGAATSDNFSNVPVEKQPWYRGLSAYAHATGCPNSPPLCLCTCYTMSGTDLAYHTTRPTLFHLGVPKSGSTSLFYALMKAMRLPAPARVRLTQARQPAGRSQGASPRNPLLTDQVPLTYLLLTSYLPSNSPATSLPCPPPYQQLPHTPDPLTSGWQTTFGGRSYTSREPKGT